MVRPNVETTLLVAEMECESPVLGLQMEQKSIVQNILLLLLCIFPSL